MAWAAKNLGGRESPLRDCDQIFTPLWIKGGPLWNSVSCIKYPRHTNHITPSFHSVPNREGYGGERGGKKERREQGTRVMGVIIRTDHRQHLFPGNQRDD